MLLRLRLLFCTMLLAPAALFANPAIAGDYPDPSVIRDDIHYWAVATSSEWGPHFPILFSKDMKTWEQKGAVFTERPEWIEQNFWAPEIWKHQDKYFVYYTGRKKGGSLCVAVATAEKPEGPYTDHGPLICQDVGSIDALPFNDNGQLWLFWKEDGNSRQLPTPIWAQRLNDEGTKFVGEKQEVMRNDPSTWEGNLIEGPFIVKHGDYYYMFYAGNACCGRKCNYGTGVARSKNLLGPYEKNPANPILKGNDTWKCPGHGSVVQDVYGRDFFMYHAYSAKDTVYVGRQAMIDEVKWGENGWPTISDGTPGTGASLPLEKYDFATSFTSAELEPGWQWPQGHMYKAAPQGRGAVIVQGADAATTNPAAGILARSTVTGSYEARSIIDTSKLSDAATTDATSRAPANAGIAVIGDPKNAIGLSYTRNKANLWLMKDGTVSEKGSEDVGAGEKLHVRVIATNGHLFQFSYSTDGVTWKSIGEKLDGSYLPPWDRGLRVGLVTNRIGRFLGFSLASK